MAYMKSTDSLNSFFNTMNAYYSYGVPKPSRYSISFVGAGPQLALNKLSKEIAINTSQFFRLLSMNCEKTSFAAASFSTNPHRIYGPVREMPYERIFSGDLSLSFREDHTLSVRQFFTEWQNNIYNTESGDINYYNDYIGDLEIIQESTGPTKNNPKDSPLYAIRLKEVYPKNINALELGHAMKDTYHTQTVELAFKDWEPIR